MGVYLKVLASTQCVEVVGVVDRANVLAQVIFPILDEFVALTHGGFLF